MLIISLNSDRVPHCILGNLGRKKALAAQPITAQLNKAGGINSLTHSLVS